MLRLKGGKMGERGNRDRKVLWEGRIALRAEERCERVRVTSNVRKQMFVQPSWVLTRHL